MAQLNFYANMEGASNQGVSTVANQALFFGFNLEDSISWNTINFFAYHTTGSKTYNIGLYSLTGSSLSLVNSASQSRTGQNFGAFQSIVNTSATSNLTPGTWYLGVLVSTSGGSNFSFGGQTQANAGNAFPGAFIGGNMTETTNALPGSYATSNLDVTGNSGIMVPFIVLSA